MEIHPPRIATIVRFALLAFVIAVFSGLAFAKSAEAGHKGHHHGQAYAHHGKAYAAPGLVLNLYSGPSYRGSLHARSHPRHGPAFVKRGHGKHGYVVQPRKHRHGHHGLYNYQRFMVSPHGLAPRRHTHRRSFYRHR